MKIGEILAGAMPLKLMRIVQWGLTLAAASFVCHDKRNMGELIEYTIDVILHI